MLKYFTVIASLSLAGCLANATDLESDAPYDDDDVAASTAELMVRPWVVWNEGTGKCLDVAGGGTGAGTRINQFDCHHGPAQQFVSFRFFDEDGVERYNINNPHSRKCLTHVTDRGRNSRTEIHPCLRGWFDGHDLVHLGELARGHSIFEVRSRRIPGYCLDVPNGSRASGIQLQYYPCHGGPNQRWVFSPAVSL